MADFRPFKGWRYNPGKVSMKEVLAPPYDIIGPEEQERLYGVSPFNCIRLILNRIETSDNEQDNRYVRARDFFEDWCEQGVLIEEEQPAFYLYRQTFVHELTGEKCARSSVLGKLKLEPFEKGIVIPHEKTLSKPRADRNKLLEVAQTNFSPVFALFEDVNQAFTALIPELTKDAPIFEVGDKAGVKHALWAIQDGQVTQKLKGIFKDKKVYIADGHHRYTSSLEHAKAKRAGLGAAPDQELGSDFTMVALVAFEDKGLILGPTHRLFAPSETFTAADAVNQLKTVFKVEEKDKDALLNELDRPAEGHTQIGLYLKGKAYLLTLEDAAKAKSHLPEGKSDFWYTLDVNLVSHLILASLWKVPQEKWESCISYTHAANEAAAAVESGKSICAFLLRSPKVSYLSELGKTGELMPQKSTYFYPKLASGLVFHHHQKPGVRNKEGA